MKKLLLTLTVVAATALTVYGQGRIGWNNYSGGLITVGTVNQGPTGGAAGALCGADNYSVQLLYALGTFADQASFDAANPTASAVITMFAGSATGSNGADAAGYYDGGVLQLGAGGTYTVQARAWFSTGFATYSAAVSGGKNAGTSALGTIVATVSPTLPNDLALPAFTVGAIIPEPSTFALAGLGAAALLLFRRRK